MDAPVHLILQISSVYNIDFVTVHIQLCLDSFAAPPGASEAKACEAIAAVPLVVET